MTSLSTGAPADAEGTEDARILSGEAVRAYYRRTAWDFHLIWSPTDFHFGLYTPGTFTHGAALRNTNRLLADLAGVGRGSRVLDAGCGVGGTTLWLARERGACVTGITLVPEQVETGRRRALAQGLAGLADFREADYTDTGLRAGSFDAVIATESLCHAPDKAAFYREASRLLRPGGRLVLAEYMRRAGDAGPGEAALVREWLEGWALPGIDTSTEHRAHAEAAGLENVRIEDWSGSFRRSLRRLYLVSAISYPLAWTAWRTGIRDRVQHGNVVGSIRCYQALQRGAWCYNLLIANKPEPG